MFVKTLNIQPINEPTYRSAHTLFSTWNALLSVRFETPFACAISSRKVSAVTRPLSHSQIRRSRALTSISFLERLVIARSLFCLGMNRTLGNVDFSRVVLPVFSASLQGTKWLDEVGA
jgi:hypothetical protein